MPTDQPTADVSHRMAGNVTISSQAGPPYNPPSPEQV